MPLTEDDKRKIEELVTKGLESDNSEKRRTAAEAKLKHRLRNSFQRINEKNDIDLTYVTCAEYQLFLDDMQKQKKFYHPDHWSNYQFPAGQAEAPISGIRPEDAQEFCKWLTKFENQENRYRLPNSVEANLFKVSNTSFGTWCRDAGEFNLVGIENTNSIRESLKPILDESNPSIMVMDLSPELEFERFDYLKFFRDFLLYPLIFFGLIAYLYLALTVFSLSLVVFIPVSAFIYLLLYFISDGAIIDVSTSFFATVLKILVIVPFLLITFSLFCNFFYIAFVLYLIFGSKSFEWVGTGVSEISESFDNLGFYLAEKIHAVIGWFARLIKSSKDTSEIPDNTADLENLTDRKVTINFDEKLEQQKSALKYYDYHFKKGKVDWLKRSKSNVIKPNVKLLKWLRVVIARKEGNLSTWEGIRLVREKNLN